MRIIAILSTLFVSVISSHARIGETKEQCTARYGPKIIDQSKDPDVLVFAKSGFRVVCYFHDNKAESLLIEKIQKSSFGKPEKMSDTEIQTILGSNGDGWVIENEKNSSAYWRSIADVIATYDTTRNNLFIGTKKGQERRREEKKSAEQKNLKGF